MRLEGPKKLMWLLMLFSVGICVYMLYYAANTFGEPYRSFSSPDGQYQVMVYPKRQQEWTMTMPGQGGDVPGIVRLCKTEGGHCLKQQRVEMVRIVDWVSWATTNVHINALGDWNLPR